MTAIPAEREVKIAMKTWVQMNETQRALVEENLSLVGQTIARHIRYNEDICGMGADDLYQEGCWALCRAAMTYDQAGRGTPFSAYARPVIRNHLLDHCRRVLSQREHLPTVALDVPVSEDIPPPEAWLQESNGQDVWDAQILVDQLLERGRRTCTGVARLGVEALALKVKGYTGADIARMYHTKPNHVGAWISRAAEKLRGDEAFASLLDRETLPKAAGF